ncbi:MAG: L-lactate permease [Bacteroidota bacterium]|nr:MAG: L-lactate permease [Bacteroidota bacterium]
MVKLLFSSLPIVLLVFLMTRKNSMPSSKALPLVALVLYFILMVVFGHDANLVHANVLSGLLVAWTPILIIAGAVFLFRTMEATGSLTIIRQWLNKLTQNKVAQLMLVGWTFTFLIEGASGFGTPAALAAPILVGLGFPPVRTAILTLIMNSISVTFGAVGTPTWFGFSAINLSAAETLEIGFKSALINSVAALVIPAIALLFVVKPQSVLRNWLFILSSVLFTIIPYLLVARFNYEFPSLVGGAVGMAGTVLLARSGFGLSKSEVQLHEKIGDSQLLHNPPLTTEPSANPSPGQIIKASFPLWGTLLLLIVTRIPQLGIRQLLDATHPALFFNLGSLGDLRVSASLVVSLEGIFGTAVGWTHKLLYVPSLLPFGVISIITFLIYSTKQKVVQDVWSETLLQLKKPTLALMGALVFVNLMMMGGETSAVTTIGRSLADLTGQSWKYFASFLGAIGAFFSGSNTISNLTFGGIQDSIALQLGLERTTILALQSVGGTMGTMVSINNIVAVSSVLALGNIEGHILKRTVRAMLVFGFIAALMAVFI